MSNGKPLDEVFEGAGQQIGIEIWRIEDFKPVPLQKSNHGKFYSGDSYIVLKTTEIKDGGAYIRDIHFWIGKDTSQDEAGTAAIKTVELDDSLGGCATQYRELQGFESDKFLSYFSPCIVPLEGGVASGFNKVEDEEFVPRLYTCKGNKFARLRRVPFELCSLDHGDVFILDTKNKIYQFNGEDSSIHERGKAFEVIQHIKDEYHEGICDVVVVDDGEPIEGEDSCDFWGLFGGFAPINSKGEDDVVEEMKTGELYSINGGMSKVEEEELSEALLDGTKCYLLDCGGEIYVWVGKDTELADRKAVSQAAEDFIVKQSRPKSTRVMRVMQGHETHSFKSNFVSWN